MPIPQKNKFRAIALLSIRTCPYRSEQEEYYAAALINSSELVNERPLPVLLEALLKYPILNDSSLSDEERDLKLGLIDVEKQQMMHASPLELLKWHTQFRLRRASKPVLLHRSSVTPSPTFCSRSNCFRSAFLPAFPPFPNTMSRLPNANFAKKAS